MAKASPVPARNSKPWLWLAGIIVLLDQISKWIVLGVLRPGESRYVAPFWNWVLAFNPGAAFSFLSDAGGWQRWFFVALAVGASLFIVWLLRSHPGQRLFAFSLSMILGGAVGNVIDRLMHGYVVDFLDFHWSFLSPMFYRGHFPAFNVADAAITAGAIGLILDELLRVRRGR